ncbi:MAG: cytochrome b/b6 domain-containing protein [Bacteroidales bacterium]|nr:cytochrome b/b6 domain-containing protein [Bacteroidales bacterium]
MKIYIYKGFERFWHWTQVLLMITLALTGFEIHSSYSLFGFENAVKLHGVAAWAYLILIVFVIFWHFTTGEWRQYKPTLKLLKAQVDYYITGIFRGAEHPTRKLIYNKFNPLQRLIYLGLNILIIPVMGVTGFAFMYLNYPNTTFELSSLDLVALIHTIGAFSVVTFIIAHVYLTTTGHTPLAAITAMLTGWEKVDPNDARAMVVNEMEVVLKATESHLKTDDHKKELLDEALEETEKFLGMKKEEKFQNVIAKSGAGYFRINKLGYYGAVNDAWIRLYKYDSADEIIGKHYSLSRTKEDFAELEKTFNRVLQGETIPHGEVKRVCKDGSLGFHTVTMTPVVMNGEVVGVEGFILDTTVRRLAEKELMENKILMEELLKKKEG